MIAVYANLMNLNNTGTIVNAILMSFIDHRGKKRYRGTGKKLI